MTTELPEVFEENGPRGGQYYFVKLSDGRRLHMSRKTGDQRVWLGRPDVAGSYMDQRGGIGSMKKLLDEWKADAEAAELYRALSALASRKSG